MDPREFLSQFPKHGEYSRKSKILLFAYYLRHHQGATEFSSAEMRGCFSEALLREPSDLSKLLKELSSGRSSPLIRVKSRYALSNEGLSEVEGILPSSTTDGESLSSFLQAALPHLQRVVAKVPDESRREYIAEAISCLGVGARRATIVLAWLATIDHLYEYVLATKLAEFNAAMHARSDRTSKLTVGSRDDFAEIKESIFIEICRSAGIITNDVRKILDEKLGTRNSCAHPSTISIGDSKVVSFIEDLVDNVVSKYPLPS